MHLSMEVMEFYFNEFAYHGFCVKRADVVKSNAMLLSGFVQG